MMVSVKSKDLLILILMVNYLATECLAHMAEKSYKWTPAIDACIIGHNNMKLGVLYMIRSVDDCRAQCKIKRADFVCSSVEYHKWTYTCVLSEANSSSSSYREPCTQRLDKGAWTFTEIIGYYEWTPAIDACIIGNNNMELGLLNWIRSLDDCRAQCKIKRADFVCSSVEYQKKTYTCHLSEANSSSTSYREPCTHRLDKGAWTFTEISGYYVTTSTLPTTTAAPTTTPPVTTSTLPTTTAAHTTTPPVTTSTLPTTTVAPTTTPPDSKVCELKGKKCGKGSVGTCKLTCNNNEQSRPRIKGCNPGTTDCTCCIPKVQESTACAPKDANSCSPPNYCVSRKQKCSKGDKRVKGACTRKVYNDKTGKMMNQKCGCCFKPVKKDENIDNYCPRCGQQIYSKDNKTDDDSKRIAGGVEISPEHKYPWLVLIKSIVNGRLYHCGGQIINSRYVLTAAHCLSDSTCNPFVSATVHVGLHRSDMTEGIDGVTRTITVKRPIPHEDYDCYAADHDNDIALLELEEDLNLKSPWQSFGIGAICLPKDDEEEYEDTEYIGIAAGWGATYETQLEAEKNPNTKKIPQEVPSEVNVAVSRKLCGNFPARAISYNMICAGDSEGGKDACAGDSGGPLMIRNRNGTYELHGITSFGPITRNCDGAGAYTRVNQYLDWIAENTNDIRCNVLHAD